MSLRLSFHFALAALVAISLIASSAPVRADAILRTEAMLASTIAEVFVEPERVRVELEVGLDDLRAFRNLLPDELLATIEPGAPPLATRVPRFFSENLVFRADGGDPLRGRLMRFESRPRVRRDEISGESRPPREDESEEIAIFIELEYPLRGDARPPGRQPAER